MTPVQPSTPEFCEAICLNLLGRRDPARLGDQSGDVAVDEVDDPVDGILAAAEPEPGDREGDVDGGEAGEQRLVADARGEQEAVVEQEVPPHAHREPRHRRLREARRP